MTNANATLRQLLPVSGDYASFNREERNYAAILYHLLLKPGGLAKFLALIGHGEVDPAATQLYFEYAYARDLWCEFGVQYKNLAARNQAYRAAITSLLQPPDNVRSLVTVKAFNSYFVGAPARASGEQIQMPGRWSHTQFDQWLKDGGREFAHRACMLKWAFNVKPDLVIQTSSDTAICVEIKVASGEGKYSMGKGDDALSMSQTAMQKYVLETLLGYQTEFVFLTRDGKVPKADGEATSATRTKGRAWGAVFEALMPHGISDELPFVHKMTKSNMLDPRVRRIAEPA